MDRSEIPENCQNFPYASAPHYSRQLSPKISLRLVSVQWSLVPVQFAIINTELWANEHVGAIEPSIHTRKEFRSQQHNLLHSNISGESAKYKKIDKINQKKINVLDGGMEDSGVVPNFVDLLEDFIVLQIVLLSSQIFSCV